MSNSFADTKKAIELAESCTAILSAYLEDALSKGIASLNRLRKTNHATLVDFHERVFVRTADGTGEILEALASQDIEEASLQTIEQVIFLRLGISEDFHSKIQPARVMLENLEKSSILPTPFDAATEEEQLDCLTAWSLWGHKVRKPLFDTYKGLSFSNQSFKGYHDLLAEIVNTIDQRALRKWRGYGQTQNIAQIKAVFKATPSGETTHQITIGVARRLIGLADEEALAQALEDFEKELHKGMKMLHAVA